MKRFFLFFTILVGLFFLHACVDPNSVYNPNSVSISGPRVLSRIDSANITIENYISNNGILTGVIANSTHNNNTSLVYSNGKLSAFTLTSTNPSNNSTLKYNITLQYDAFGNVILAVKDISLGNVLKNHVLITVNNDSAGKPIKAYYKIGFVNQTTPSIINYTQFSEETITYNGSNVFAINTTNGLLEANGTVTPGSTNSFLYEYPSYDAKKSPYSTLPKEYNLCMSFLHSAKYATLSPNNPLKIKISYPLAPVIEANTAFLYDDQNFATTDASGTNKYYYKAY